MTPAAAAFRQGFCLLALLAAAAPVRARDPRVLAREGPGALLEVGGARVCLRAGSPEKMGCQGDWQPCQHLNLRPLPELIPD